MLLYHSFSFLRCMIGIENQDPYNQDKDTISINASATPTLRCSRKEQEKPEDSLVDLDTLPNFYTNNDHLENQACLENKPSSTTISSIPPDNLTSIGASPYPIQDNVLIKNYQEQISDANISVLIESNEEKDNLQELRECLFDSMTDSQKEAPNVREKTDTATSLSDSNDWPDLLNDKFTTCNKTCLERETANESLLNLPRNIRNSQGVSLSSSFSSNADGNLS